MNNLKNCLEEIRGMIKEAEKPPDTSKEERIAELNNMDRLVYAAGVADYSPPLQRFLGAVLRGTKPRI